MAIILLALILIGLYVLLQAKPAKPQYGTTIDCQWEFKKNKYIITYRPNPNQHWEYGVTGSFTPHELDEFLKKNGIPSIDFVTSEMLNDGKRPVYGY